MGLCLWNLKTLMEEEEQALQVEEEGHLEFLNLRQMLQTGHHHGQEYPCDV